MTVRASAEGLKYLSSWCGENKVMANRPAAPLLLRQGNRETLQRLVHSTSVRAGPAQRARIVLLAAQSTSNTEIA